jgi:hypothetical protein
VKTSTQLDQIDALAFIAPGGWLQLFCNEQPGVDQLDLTLPASGTVLALQDTTGTTFETVTLECRRKASRKGGCRTEPGRRHRSTAVPVQAPRITSRRRRSRPQ